MREVDKHVFYEVANEFQCWIGLREPNQFSEKWIGSILHGHSCQPKGVSCKAKTSDNPSFRYAGLVVNPLICPEAFRRDNLESVQLKFKVDFLLGESLPPNFYCINTGEEKGLIRYYDSYLFADYDLMAVSKSNRVGERLFTSQSEEAALFRKIKPILNGKFGQPLIQHGTEFMYDKGVGAKESEQVFWFGPGKRFQVAVSSMPKGGH
jgi:hypothetical protein